MIAQALLFIARRQASLRDGTRGGILAVLLFGTIKRADLSAIKIKTAELSLIAIAPLNLF
jgi:hypothetical protein